MIHCIHCGEQLPQPHWPKQCPRDTCGKFNYSSPKPVVALVVPSWGPKGSTPSHPGVVVIKRGIEPFKGTYAFPGGYIDHGESWQQAAIRECHEELGFTPDLRHLRLLDTVSSSPKHLFLILFVGLVGHVLTPQDWHMTGCTNDTGEQEILGIEVWDADHRDKELGIPEHETFFQAMKFKP